MNRNTDTAACAGLCPCVSPCPIGRALAVIGGKWKMRIVCTLYVDGTQRYNDLVRKTSGVTNAMLSSSLKTAVMSLPKRERDLIESKFFKEKKLHEISDEFSISQSRISRIIKSGLDKLKDELIKNEAI